MISTKSWCVSFLSVISLFTIVSTLSAEEINWVLIHRGKGSDADVYYNKQSIKKIDDNIMEVYITVVRSSNKNFIQQTRIDCKNKKHANGMSDVYINGNKTQSMDFSKAGWVWLPTKNSVDKKLLNLVCTKK